MKQKILTSLILLFILGTGLIYKNLYSVKEFIIESPFSRIYVKHFRDGPAVDESHLISTLDNGMKIVVNKYDECVCWFIRLLGHWDSNETAAIHYLVKPGFSIIEVGANFGVHTLTMAGLVGPEGHIDAFEANPHVSKYLRQSVGLNALESIISVYEQAAGDSTGRAHLVFGGQNIGGGHLVAAPSDQAVETSIVRLDDVIKPHHGKVDLLKIDAEGSEAKIIQGAAQLMRANPRMILMLEWFQEALIKQGSDPKAFLNHLRNQGFHAWKIGKRKGSEPTFVPLSFDEILEIPYCDLVLSKEKTL